MKKSNEKSLTKLADAAFKQAAQKVIERAVASGTPVIVWKNGAIQEVEPGKIPKGRKAKKET